MRRRIREAIVGVTAAILVILGIPLAVAVHRLIIDAEVVKLQAAATRTLAEISVPFDRRELAAIRGETDAPPPFTVYDATGHRVFGAGPRRADALVRQALRGNLATRITETIDVASPISDRAPDERVIGAVRVTESLAGADHRSRVAWLLMAGSAGLAIGLAWLIGNRLARRLSQPIIDLASGAERIGDGGTLTRPSSSGIDEIDSLALALADSTERVNEALARERRFSADVSHQLRTPITALRLQLEAARDDEDRLAIGPALNDLDRLEDTVDHLLAVARDAMPIVSNARLDQAVRDASRRWQARAEAVGRAVRPVIVDTAAMRGSAASIAQILDVLVDNALHHGRGTVEIAVRPLPGGAALDVSDEGDGIVLSDIGRIFDRGHGNGHGIGLALARSIAEAEGGRLVLTHVQPTTFSLILVDHDPALEADRQ
ncbi:MAG: ATP-binding protein [Acidimicrobiales bacterium]